MQTLFKQMLPLLLREPHNERSGDERHSSEEERQSKVPN